MLETVNVTQAKGYTKGNLNYEMTLQYYSTINVLNDGSFIKNSKPQKIKFNEIPLKTGLISKKYKLL